MAECIHGFDEGLCDLCFPRQVAEPVATLTAPTTRTATRRAATPRVRRVPGAPSTASPGLPPFSTRRLYHVTHSRNLESILTDGAIRSVAAGADPEVDVAAPIVRQLRAAADVGDGRPVSEFVPFSLSPHSQRWAELRTGAAGAHWSAAARLATATEYVILVAGTKQIGSDVVIADGDASAPATGFVLGDPAKAIAQAAHTDPDLSGVELLVADRVPLEAVVLIGVPNEPMRTRVRRMFHALDTVVPKVVVHPPWFMPQEE